MRRYWIQPQYLTDTEAQIEGDLFHHIVDVCRLQEGDKFELLPGNGKAFLVRLGPLSKKRAKATVLETRDIQPLRRPYIHLCLSVPRFQKLETILEKAVELGVHEVIPFVSDFSFVRTLGGPLTEKRGRWLKIIQSATEQSGRGEVMQLAEAATLKEVFERFNQQTNAAGLFPYEGEGDVGIKEALGAISSPSDLWIFVGSEGGFSHKEVEFFRSGGLKPVTLGPQVLRVETACLALVSVLKYHFDLMK
ncbi:MAG TPA: 16S rRNA (uracil(1498)-N(3))-methyltransferase [Bdellovibrionales bacterium]|nr:16S rRNA (uracil(1498)-N(3))-methyltransferase [Bdellovibrionales bacterium]